MKTGFIVLLLGLPFFMAACAHPLEQIVDANHQARLDAVNTHGSIARGAGDGLGSSYVEQNRELDAALKTQP